MNVFDKIDYPVRDPNLITDVVGGFHDVTSPLVSSATISEDGTETTIVFNEAALMVGYDSGDFALDCSVTDTNLSDPSGSGTTWVFSNVETIGAGETCTLDYTGSAGEITDLAGNSLAGFTDAAVTNLNEGAAACATAEIVPTFSTLQTGWAAYPSGTILEAIDELIAARDTNNSGYISDYLHAPLTMRFSLPGDCDVSTIRVELYADAAAASVSVNVDISNNDSDYETAQGANLVSNTPTAFPKTFSDLAWTTPAYCYVRITPTSSQYSNVRVYSLSITVSP